MAAMPDRFWNEAIETLTPAETRRLENERLAEQIAWDVATSPFYRARLDAAGVRADQIRDVEDLARIPLMEKAEIADSQADGTLLGVNQCAPLDTIVRIQATGGTTGQPMRIGLTRRDIADYGEMGARALWAMGCRPGDIVFECMNYNLYAGGLSDHLTFETLGAATIPFGVGHSERLLTMMAGLTDPVGIWATPSYAVRLAEVAAQLGMEPRDVGLRRGYFSGEAGLQVPGYRERIEATWGMVARDQYGTGELGLHSGECDERDGVHFGGDRLRRGGADRSRVGRGPAVHRRPAGRGGLHLDPARGVAAAADAVARPDAGVHRAVPVRTDELPVPDPRPVRRHVHRQGRERLPAGGAGRPDAARAARDRRVPGRHRPSAADRLPGADHGRGRGRRPGGRRTRRSPAMSRRDSRPSSTSRRR